MAATLAEQIGAFEAKRAANVAAMSAIMEKSATDGATLDQAQQDEFDDLEADNEAIDGHLKRLRVMEKANLATLKPVVANNDKTGSETRDPRTRVEVKGAVKLPPGVGFSRYVGALAVAKGNRFEAAEFAKSKWGDNGADIVAMLRTPADVLEKTAVNAGTTTDSTWAAPLAQYNNLGSEFIDYLRPATIIGRIQGMRRVPFKVKVPRATGGASVNWVGEGKVKPLTSMAFDSVTLDHNKIAGIVPLTEELVRFSTPSAEMLVRDDLAAAIAQFQDIEFIDISNASTDVSPASVTYGVSAVTSTGTTASAFRADMASALDTLIALNIPLTSVVIVMTPTQALRLSLMQNAMGGPEFPGITMNGGSLAGFPVITTTNLSATTASPADGYPITFIAASEILLADDGGVTVDVSREASLQMETTPDSPFTASTVLVNLWQHNMIAVKVEQFITWKPRRTTVAAVIAGAKYAE